jgi:hypothetical protein
MDGELGCREEGGDWVTGEAAPGDGVSAGIEGRGPMARHDLLVNGREVRVGDCHDRESWRRSSIQWCVLVVDAVGLW